MLFKKYKNKIKSLEKDLSFWQKNCDELKNTINTLREENKCLKDNNNKLNTEIINMEHLSKENEIMRKYYKVDEIPSPDVQAKILADLRLHDMECKILQEQLNDCKKQLSFNQTLLSTLSGLPRLYI